MNNHFLCVRGNKAFNLRFNNVYVREGNELVHYSKRFQTRLLGANDMLCLPKTFREFDSPTGEGCDCDDCREKQQSTRTTFETPTGGKFTTGKN